MVGMHFKIGLCKYQSASVLDAASTALVNNPELLAGRMDGMENINFPACEPVFGIIGEPAQKDQLIAPWPSSCHGAL